MDIAQRLAEAREAMQRGSLSEAERACRSILHDLPEHYHALILLGEILTRAGQGAEAVVAYEAAAAAQPGASVPFSRLAISRFRKTFGPPLPPRPEATPGRPRVQMRSLGANGRFGNQLLQYAFVRLYAERHDLIAEFPDWIGRDVFDLDDPFPSARLPTIDEKDADLFGSLHGRTGQVFADRDIRGYFCGDTRAWGALKPDFIARFTPAPRIRPLLDQALHRLHAAGNTIVGIHLRLSDFGYGRFWVAPPSWYAAWLRTIWAGLDRPVLYIASDLPGPHAEFADLAPWTADRMGIDVPGIDFLVDHHVLRHADHLAIANSTFSFTAAMLNRHGASFMRPDPALRALTPFDPWAAEVLQDVTVEPGAVAEGERRLIERRLRPADTVVHWGRYCSPWTNFARSVHRNLMVLETEGDASLCRALRGRGIRKLRLLVLENLAIVHTFLGDADRILRQADVEAVLFRLDGKAESDGVLPKIAALDYVAFGLHRDKLVRARLVETGEPGSYLAVRRELVLQFESRLSRFCSQARPLLRGHFDADRT